MFIISSSSLRHLYTTKKRKYKSSSSSFENTDSPYSTHLSFCHKKQQHMKKLNSLQHLCAAKKRFTLKLNFRIHPRWLRHHLGRGRKFETLLEWLKKQPVVGGVKVHLEEKDLSFIPMNQSMQQRLGSQNCPRFEIKPIPNNHQEDYTV